MLDIIVVNSLCVNHTFCGLNFNNYNFLFWSLCFLYVVNPCFLIHTSKINHQQNNTLYNAYLMCSKVRWWFFRENVLLWWVLPCFHFILRKFLSPLLCKFFLTFNVTLFLQVYSDITKSIRKKYLISRIKYRQIYKYIRISSPQYWHLPLCSCWKYCGNTL